VNTEITEKRRKGRGAYTNTNEMHVFSNGERCPYIHFLLLKNCAAQEAAGHTLHAQRALKAKEQRKKKEQH
jgi:hypothetical protein